MLWRNIADRGGWLRVWVLLLALWPAGAAAQEAGGAAEPPAPPSPQSPPPVSAPAAPRASQGLLDRLPCDPPIPGSGPRDHPTGDAAPRRAAPAGQPVRPRRGGPGISQSGDENFLDGALDPRTGWPFVLLDHFRPRPERVERFWVVQTRDCPQEMGTDPWPELKVLHFDADGRAGRARPAPSCSPRPPAGPSWSRSRGA